MKQQIQIKQLFDTAFQSSHKMQYMHMMYFYMICPLWYSHYSRIVILCVFQRLIKSVGLNTIYVK